MTPQPMKIRIVVLAVLLAALAAVAVSQTTQTRKHHVVFQMVTDNKDAWEGLFANIRNAQKIFGADTMEIEVVVYSSGIEMLRKTNTGMEAAMKKAIDTRVVLSACQNSMRAHKITTEDLFPFASQVDSGVAEVIRKQEAGWSYVRAGN